MTPSVKVSNVPPTQAVAEVAVAAAEVVAAEVVAAEEAAEEAVVVEAAADPQEEPTNNQ